MEKKIFFCLGLVLVMWLGNGSKVHAQAPAQATGVSYYELIVEEPTYCLNRDKILVEVYKKKEKLCDTTLMGEVIYEPSCHKVEKFFTPRDSIVGLRLYIHYMSTFHDSYKNLYFDTNAFASCYVVGDPNIELLDSTHFEQHAEPIEFRSNPGIFVNFRVSRIPNVILTKTAGSNNYFSDFSPIVIITDSLLQHSDYEWQYSNDNTMSWHTIAWGSNLKINGNQFLSPSDYGKKIFIKEAFNGDSSNAIFFTYLPSAPTITSLTTTPTCSNDNSGSVKINFSRQLVAGEKLAINVSDRNNPDPQSSLIAQVNNLTSLDSLNGVYFHTFTNLPAGDDSISLIGYYDTISTYTEGPNYHKNFTISSIPTLNYTLSSSDVWCHGGNDGEIKIKATGGILNTTQYRITQMSSTGINTIIPWTSFKDSTTVSNLYPNTYQVLVRDSSGCGVKYNGTYVNNQSPPTIQIREPASSLSMNKTKGNLKYYQGSNSAGGYLTYVITGGTPLADGSYTYELRKGGAAGALQPSSSMEVVHTPSNECTIRYEGLPAGIYCFTVKDKNWSSATQKGNCGFISVLDTVVEPVYSHIDSTTNVWCYGEQNGEIYLSAYGGEPLASGVYYEYKLVSSHVTDTSTVAWIPFNGAVQHHFTGLSPDTYQLYVRDNYGNIAIDSHTLNEQVQTVKITAPSAALSVLKTAQVQCTLRGASQGSLSYRIAGGTPYVNNSYTYRLRLNNPSTGTVVTASSAQVHANPSSYDLTFDHLVAGIYYLSVADSNYSHCGTITKLDTITEPLAVSFVIDTLIHVACYGEQNGSISFSAHGGMPEKDSTSYYEYQISGSSTWKTLDQITQQTIINLASGSYRLQVRDNYGGLSDVQTVEVKAPVSALQVQRIAKNNATIYNASNGALTYTVSGGTPFVGGSYECVLKKADSSMVTPTSNQIITSPASYQVSFDGLGEGIYNLRVQDQNGCSNSILMDTITQPAPPVNFAIDGIVDVWCYKGNDGEIQVLASGGLPATGVGDYIYEYQLNKGRWQPFNQRDRQVFTSLEAGTYLIQVRDSYGTIARDPRDTTQFLVDTVIIHAPQDSFQVKELAHQDASVFNWADGSLTYQVSGGTPPKNGSYDYALTDSLGALCTHVQSQISLHGFTITFDSLKAGNYQLICKDRNYDAATNKGGCGYANLNIQITQPAPVSFQVDSVVDVSCNQGSDGAIHLKAAGGVPVGITSAYYEYQLHRSISDTAGWKRFTAGNQSWITGLIKGNYQLKVRDSYGNQAKGSGGHGIPVVVTIIIHQPTSPLDVKRIARKEPTANGWSDGSLSYQISGGTPFSNGSYSYELHEDSITGPLMQVVTTKIDSAFEITFFNLKATSYFLSIKDSHWSGAIDKVEGRIKGVGTCGYIHQQEQLHQPPALRAQIMLLQSIECNDQNNNNSGKDSNNDGVLDEFETGILSAVCSGGIERDTSVWDKRKYIYTWEYQNPQTMQWIPVKQTNQVNLGSKIETLPAGNYRFNMQDKNGVVLGKYTSKVDARGIYHYQLSQRLNQAFYLPKPAELKIEFETHSAVCGDISSGSIFAKATGGRPWKGNHYTYQWSRGTQDTAFLNHLNSGKYEVWVKDSCGCSASAVTEVQLPGTLHLDTLIYKNPSCVGASDGAIQIQAQGGVAPYTYTWSTGETGQTLQNKKAGNYVLNLSDSEGCTGVINMELKDPTPLTVHLPDTVALCSGQQYQPEVDVKNDQIYTWTKNGKDFSMLPIPTINIQGNYQLTVQNSAGCSASASVYVKVSNEELNPEFLMSSQAFVGDQVFVVNVTQPDPDSIAWILPKEASIESDSLGLLELIFHQAGTFKIGLIAHQGNCESTYGSTIIISEKSNLPDAGDAKTPFITSFTVSPNPTKGQFNIQVELQKESSIAVSVFALSKNVLTKITKQGQSSYTIPYTIGSPGVYMVVLETPQGRDLRKVIVY